MFPIFDSKIEDIRYFDGAKKKQSIYREKMKPIVRVKKQVKVDISRKKTTVDVLTEKGYKIDIQSINKNSIYDGKIKDIDLLTQKKK